MLPFANNNTVYAYISTDKCGITVQIIFSVYTNIVGS